MFQFFYWVFYFCFHIFKNFYFKNFIIYFITHCMLRDTLHNLLAGVDEDNCTIFHQSGKCFLNQCSPNPLNIVTINSRDAPTSSHQSPLIWIIGKLFFLLATFCQTSQNSQLQWFSVASGIPAREFWLTGQNCYKKNFTLLFKVFLAGLINWHETD